MVYEKLHLKDFYPFLGENGADPTVETYLPYNSAECGRADKKRPCMVITPGGGYGFCSEREAEPIALKLLPEGYNVFVLKYSVEPHRFPTQIIEVAALMELIYKNTDAWMCDTERILICGFSAGGHLASHYTNAYDCEEVRSVFPESKPVNGSVLCYPVITADPENSHKGSFVNLLGKETEELTKEDIDRFSADRLVNEKTPPAFIWHTAEDGVVPVANSLLYAAALSENKIPYELHIYPFGPHGSSTCDKQTYSNPPEKLIYVNSWFDNLKNWLKEMKFTD